MLKHRNICLIGTGKIARHLAEKLVSIADYSVCIWGRNVEAAQTISQETGIKLLKDISEIPASSIGILCVSDHAIQNVAHTLASRFELIIHLSGTSSIDLLKDSAAHTAVMWPNQSFTPGNIINWKNVPLCLEASDEFAHNELSELAKNLGGPFAWLTGEQRRMLHLAAVGANNFVNHLMVLTEEWCLANGLDFQFLMPMIEQSAQRFKTSSPKLTQTGPASRNDQSTIALHLSMLKDFPEFAEVYALLSKQISERSKRN